MYCIQYIRVYASLNDGIRSEKCVVRRFRRANVIRVYLLKPRQYSLLHT
jgi:hypothetical protein